VETHQVRVGSRQQQDSLACQPAFERLEKWAGRRNVLYDLGTPDQVEATATEVIAGNHAVRRNLEIQVLLTRPGDNAWIDAGYPPTKGMPREVEHEAEATADLEVVADVPRADLVEQIGHHVDAGRQLDVEVDVVANRGAIFDVGRFGQVVEEHRATVATTQHV